MTKADKRLIYSIIFITIGIIFVISQSDYIKTVAIFLLVGGGAFFGSSITLRNN